MRLSERASVAAAVSRGGAVVRQVPGARSRPGPPGWRSAACPHGRYAVNVVARDPSGLRTSVTRAVRLPQIVTVAVSGDLLIHTPVAARALANGGRRSYRFGPMLARISPSSAGPIHALPSRAPPRPRASDRLSRVSAPRSRWPARSARRASTSAARPRTTPSTTASPASSPPWPALDGAGVRHTGSWTRPPPRAAPPSWRPGGDGWDRLGHRAHERHRSAVPVVGGARRRAPSWRPPAAPAAPGRGPSSSTCTGAPSTGTRRRPHSGVWPAFSRARPP